MKTRRKEQVDYPFSKARVYFNGLTGLLALAFSLFFLATSSTLLNALLYALLTAMTVLLSLKLKLHLLRRMEEKSESDSIGDQDTRSSSFSWSLVLVMISLILVLLVLIIAALIVDPLWWFICFSCYVVGFSLSEPLLYKSVNH